MDKSVRIRDLESRVGQEIAVSPWVDMPQERIDLFAKATEDYQWIHVDPERAKKSPFGTTIAHGFLTLSLLVHLQASLKGGDERPAPNFTGMVAGVNYGFEKIRFTAPVPAGSRIRGRFTLAKYEKLDGNGVQTTWGVVMEREGGDKPVCIAETISRHYF